ncbi:MAG: inositol monophosphatase [alpha proteobacterium HIMB114]|jgi:myo-inositol-1(or 4)-monophosphatase|nr:MAG: inositol monophosphatase [alpha proteobacterium HIMB114]|tara:strand:+ start:592 stop:1377 length:786 start_codon:yes stop_codon:yes gene_type:complete
MPLLSAEINVLEKICDKVSKVIIRDFGEVEKLQVSRKGPGDFVTKTDKKVEKIIIEELEKARPKYGFIAEESGERKNESEFNWVIDPIDGTSNFMHGIPHFAISIALEKNGEVISGIVCDPIKNETFYAEKGRGAYLNNRRIRVSSRKSLDEVIGLYGCPPMIKIDGNKFFDQIKKASSQIHKLRNYGSAALDFTYVAAGRADFAWYDHLNYWDYAAGKIILLEAGGTITDFAGKSFVKQKETFISNSYIHDEVIKILFKN